MKIQITLDGETRTLEKIAVFIKHLPMLWLSIPGIWMLHNIVELEKIVQTSGGTSSFLAFWGTIWVFAILGGVVFSVYYGMCTNVIENAWYAIDRKHDEKET